MEKAKNNKGLLQRLRFLRYLLPFIILGSAVYIFLTRMTTLENSIKVLRSMSIWMVCLAALAEVCSYFGSGYLLKVIMSLGESRFSIFRGVLITLAAASIGLVMGGWVSVAATTYYWVSKSEDVSEESKLTGFLPTLYNDTLLVILASVGLLYLLIIHDLSSFQNILYSIILLIFGLAIMSVIYGIKHRDKVERLSLAVEKLFMRIRKQPYKSTVIHDTIDDVYVGLELLRKKGWKKPAIGSCLNIGFDMLVLYFLFIAAGHAVNPLILIAGYSMAFILGILAFFIPGGVGVVETGMVAIFTSLGVPASVNIVVILSYRLFSFWLPSFLGFAASAYLERIREKL